MSIPASLNTALTPAERRCPSLTLSDGRYLVASRTELIILSATGPERAHWDEVARAHWRGEEEYFHLEWMDPARAALEGTTSGRVDTFLRAITERVNSSIVTHAEATAPGGSTVTVWVRRRGDSLYSVLVADGPLDEAGRAFADQLEAQVREDVGLD